MYLFIFNHVAHKGSNCTRTNTLTQSQITAICDQKKFKPLFIHQAGKVLQHEYQAESFTVEKINNDM